MNEYVIIYDNCFYKNYINSNIKDIFNIDKEYYLDLINTNIFDDNLKLLDNIINDTINSNIIFCVGFDLYNNKDKLKYYEKLLDLIRYNFYKNYIIIIPWFFLKDEVKEINKRLLNIFNSYNILFIPKLNEMINQYELNNLGINNLINKILVNY